ncbi:MULTISPECIES: Gfo/Idh/MocA family oxidoreductase [unclassified Actinomyces]|uniref:Gfo/Idh/MocA family protein n=1 Tax=unclassified Actinomyces TaxID=2609248 RepID=UPI0020173E61|nr:MULTISPECIES: Gfo/Idh/MocA family oxidoreductase [unclassified Actinomyces]MCL3778279.1 Gfo/Idh/MocA family oxidoreductase [Actinomyces sp. AC-20-1]MCL3788741.1 Gfo/Idh/MocA family oxidoreductase [Actinomyces sp. 187325]MCL3792856.1 Gfo/Idh/MocA family oxidoreductase [Actinomyces sp. 186855]MCL3794371.1 Gfo/Idh/MocA family oxidoreductase [Actinomyces sp. 217892]
MSDNIRLGIIGLGAEGGMYAGFIASGRVPGMEIGAICDILPEKKEAADGYGVPFYTDYRQMVTSGDVDAVVTTVPHYLHPEVGVYALEHGVHALVEKPVGVYTKQAKELISYAATRPELTFGVFFNQRTNPLYQDLRRLIASGELGALKHTTWTITTWWRPQGYYDQSAWRATWGGEGGGVLVNQAPHQLDLWQWVCGVPRSVFAKCQYGFRRDIAVEDEVNALVDFGDGATGSFITCTNDIAGTDRLEILCDKGKVVVEDSQTVTITRLNEDERTLSAGMSMEDVKNLFTGALDPTTLMTTETKDYGSVWGEQHCEVLRNFAAAVRGEEELLAPGADGIHGVRLANAIHLSSWTGQEVSIEDFDEDTYLTLLNERIAAEGAFEERA